MAASGGFIWRNAVMTAVMAGLKCAPEASASVWIRTNRMNTCTRPITDQSMNGAGFCGDGCARNSERAAVTKNTSAAVPMNSATYAAGPRSCTGDLLDGSATPGRAAPGLDRAGSLVTATVAIGFRLVHASSAPRLAAAAALA